MEEKALQKPEDKGPQWVHPLNDSNWRYLLYGFATWLKCAGWAAPVGLSMYLHPKTTATSYALYHVWLSRTKQWQDFVRYLLYLGSPPNYQEVTLFTKPLDKTKRYLISVHPHGFFADGAVLAVQTNINFHKTGISLVGDIVAPCAVGKYAELLPVLRELVGGGRADSACISADKKAIVKALEKSSVCIVPGGFSEILFAVPHDKYEYLYLKGRKGFVVAAIEAGVDIVPCYIFGATRQYEQPTCARQSRAQLSQKWSLPFTVPMGRWGTSYPLTDQTTSVAFDPFPASKYTMEQADEAHADYLVYLSKCFDSQKANYNMAHKEIKYVGKADKKKPKPTNIANIPKSPLGPVSKL